MVNDRFGHDVGDEVIVTTAAVLRNASRSTDVVARIGGEEFGLLLPDTSLEGAQNMAERLHAAIAQIRMVRAAGPVALSVSIGVSEATLGATIFDLMKEADVALYEAKAGGRNRTCTFDRSRRQAA